MVPFAFLSVWFFFSEKGGRIHSSAPPLNKCPLGADIHPLRVTTNTPDPTERFEWHRGHTRIYYFLLEIQNKCSNPPSFIDFSRFRKQRLLFSMLDLLSEILVRHPNSTNEMSVCLVPQPFRRNFEGHR